MTKPQENKGQPEALATFGAAARKGNKPGETLTVTPETSYKPGDLAVEEKDAGNILGGTRPATKPRWMPR